MVKYKRIIILVVVFLGMTWFGSHPYWVERYYSTGIYPYMAILLRGLFGWVPFSLGDAGYFACGIWLLTGLWCFLRRLFRREWTFPQWLGWGRRFMEGILIIVIVFNGLWALNYNRLGIAYQLQLRPEDYSEATLQTLIDSLTDRMNRTRLSIGTHRVYPDDPAREAIQAYGQLNKTYPFLRYRVRSVKASLYGELGDYMGFLGYYNPFTGEAQVNRTVPQFSTPYTTCHEMAHQLGYASESEANFVGYLAAVHSTDTLFRYSTYFDLFTYANREMFVRDSAAARRNYRRLDTLVKLDFKEWALFLRAHRNPLEPILNKMYDGYLKANNQPKGIASYDEVTGWLIAYGKKYGAL
jgi:hypothetical protein